MNKLSSNLIRLFLPTMLATTALSAHAALEGRDLDGNANTFEAYYDTLLGISWLGDWNYAKTSGYDPLGRMNWSRATSWAAQLNYFGITGWRLPGVSPVNGTSFQVPFLATNNGTTDIGWARTGVGWGAASELGHLYYVTLGNRGQCTPNDADPTSCNFQAGWGMTNTGPFRNSPGGLQYWTGADYPAYPGAAFEFETAYGYQGWAEKQDAFLLALAVHQGDVGAIAVPEPQSGAMLIAGLALLALRSRRAWR